MSKLGVCDNQSLTLNILGKKAICGGIEMGLKDSSNFRNSVMGPEVDVSTIGV
jgi:hypothetical protein